MDYEEEKTEEPVPTMDIPDFGIKIVDASTDEVEIEGEPRLISIAFPIDRKDPIEFDFVGQFSAKDINNVNRQLIRAFQKHRRDSIIAAKKETEDA